jgi:hypothetical protein
MIEMTGKQALLEQLVAEGVQHVFGNPGTSEQPFMDLLQDYPQLQYVLALHEATAVGMADGYAWASGRPAFVQLHIAPGLGNAGPVTRRRTGRAGRLCRQHAPSAVVQEAIRPATSAHRRAADHGRWKWTRCRHPHHPAGRLRCRRRGRCVPIHRQRTNGGDEIAPATCTPLAGAPDRRHREQPPSLPTPAVGHRLRRRRATSALSPKPFNIRDAGATVYSSFAVQLTFPFDHPLSGLLNLIRPAGLRSQLAQADVSSMGAGLPFRLCPGPSPPTPRSSRWTRALSWPKLAGHRGHGADPLGLRDLAVLPDSYRRRPAGRQTLASTPPRAARSDGRTLNRSHGRTDAVPIRCPA